MQNPVGAEAQGFPTEAPLWFGRRRYAGEQRDQRANRCGMEVMESSQALSSQILGIYGRQNYLRFGFLYLHESLEYLAGYVYALGTCTFCKSAQ
jgi:hypothetical protein